MIGELPLLARCAGRAHLELESAAPLSSEVSTVFYRKDWSLSYLHPLSSICMHVSGEKGKGIATHL